MPVSAIRRVEADIVGRLGDRPDVPNYMVFVTTTIGGNPTLDAINNIKRMGTRVIGVGQCNRNMESKRGEGEVNIKYHHH